MRMKWRTPRSNSSCSTIAAIGPPMPNAEAVTRRPARRPVTVRSPRFSSTNRGASRCSAIRSIRARSPTKIAASPISSSAPPMYQARRLISIDHPLSWGHGRPYAVSPRSPSKLFCQAFPNPAHFSPSLSKNSFGGFVGFQWVTTLQTPILASSKFLISRADRSAPGPRPMHSGSAEGIE